MRWISARATATLVALVSLDWLANTFCHETRVRRERTNLERLKIFRPGEHSVLVISRNPGVVEEVQRALDGYGWKVLSANSPESARNFLARQQGNTAKEPSLALAEVDGEEGKSSEFVDRVRAAIGKDVPLLFLFDTNSDRIVDALCRGAAGCFIRPVISKDFVYGLSMRLDSHDHTYERQFKRARLIYMYADYQFDGQAIRGCVINLSRSGMQIASLKPLPSVGQLIQVRLNPYDGSPSVVHGEAEVRWFNPTFQFGNAPAFGVEFVAWSAKASEALDSILANIFCL